MLSRPPDADQGNLDNTDITVLPLKLFIQNIIFSDEQKREIIKEYHDAPTAGHPGQDNTITLVKEKYLWPGMTKWISQYVKGCAVCQQNKTCHQKKTPLFCIPIPENTKLFEIIALDLITQLPMSEGYDAILTIVDHGLT